MRKKPDMKDFNLNNLERKNIYKVPENMFDNIQEKVLSGVKDFDLDKLERKNIYKVQDDLFSTVQNNVLKEISGNKKTPIFNLNWGYAAAASLALIFGSTFIFSNNEANVVETENSITKSDTKINESQIAYQTLKDDLTSVENSNQKAISQKDVKVSVVKSEVTQNTNKANLPKKISAETRMNEYLDSFTSSEIAELANNSNQDVYLDLYN